MDSSNNVETARKIEQTSVDNRNQGAAKAYGLSSGDRMKRLLQDVISVNSNILKNDANLNSYELNDDVCDLLTAYAKELTSAIVEESASLAKHRGSEEITECDVNLILGIYRLCI